MQKGTVYDVDQPGMNLFPNLNTWPGHDLFSALPTILTAKLNGETDLFNLAFLSDIVMAALAKVLVNWVLADGQQGTHVPSLFKPTTKSYLVGLVISCYLFYNNNVDHCIGDTGFANHVSVAISQSYL